MTNDRLELLLAFGLVFVYLFDAMRFLGQREALVERIAGDRWRLRFGAVGVELLGRRLALPNPLRPDRVSFVARWRLAMDTGVDAAGIRWPDAGMPGAVLGWLCLALFGLVVISAPALLVIGRNLWFAGVVAAGYLIATVAATLLVLYAARFGLKRSSALGIGVIGVLCPPCAPNLLRAACGGRKLEVELPAFAEASADAMDRQVFHASFARVLRQELLQESDDPRQSAALQAILRRCEERA